MYDGAPLKHRGTMKPAVFCIIGKQNAGKTTLITKIVRKLRVRGIRVSTVKHVSHDFELDTRGKDSYRHFHAGAMKTVVVSRKRMGLFVHLERPLKARELIRHYFSDQDLVIIEGYSDSRYPKIEVDRSRRGSKEPPRFEQYGISVDAVITNRPRAFPDMTTLPLNRIETIVRFILKRYVRPPR